MTQTHCSLPSGGDWGLGLACGVVSTVKVASPPVKAVMIYDGDCNFCSLWIHRWQLTTGDQLDYLPFQDPSVAARFPEVPRGQFETAVQLVEPDGHVYGGAEAVFRALARHPQKAWLLGWYEQSPVFAHATEWGYRLVARHRGFFSALTRLAWGRHLDPPTHNLVRWVFLRSLGLIYLIAFVSLWVQIIGLIGRNGILPADSAMDSIRLAADAQRIGLDRYHLVPTLCWFNTSDGFLSAQCAAGALLAVLVIVGIAPAPCLFLLWLLYLSLATVCREFLGFQWDNCCWRPASWRSSWHPCNCGPASCLVPRGPRAWCSGCCAGCFSS